MSGHIRKRKRSDGSTGWQVRWPENGKEVLRTFDLKRDAQRWLQDRQAAALRGDLISPEQQVMTVAELAGEWRATWPGRLQPSSQIRCDQVLAKHILPSLGHHRAATLTHADVAMFLRTLPASLAPATVRKVHATLSAAFTEGIRSGHVRVNPCRHQRLPRIPKQERCIVSQDQLESIAAAAESGSEPVFATAIRLAFYTGLRAGEQWALRHEDIRDGRITVSRSLRVINGRHEFGPTKTHRVRRVSLPGFLLDELSKSAPGSDIASRSKSALSSDSANGSRNESNSDFAIGSKSAPGADSAIGSKSERRSDSELIFRGPHGAPIRHNLFVERVFKPACEAVGIDGLRWHDLRHSHGSYLLARGVPIHVVKERLGHTSIQTTVDVYGHLIPGADDEVARLFD